MAYGKKCVYFSWASNSQGHNSLLPIWKKNSPRIHSYSYNITFNDYFLLFGHFHDAGQFVRLSTTIDIFLKQSKFFPYPKQAYLKHYGWISLLESFLSSIINKTNDIDWCPNNTVNTVNNTRAQLIWFVLIMITLFWHLIIVPGPSICNRSQLFFLWTNWTRIIHK